MKPNPSRVLIADDNHDIADTTALLLESKGCAVRAVYDGLQAVKAARVFVPHLVILDIDMPVIDGYAAAQMIREHYAGRFLVLVAHTARSQPKDVQRTYRAGFDHHVAKPADIERLCALVDSSLSAAD